jgi:hypothetical protein
LGFGYNVSTFSDYDPAKGRNILAKAKYIYTW